MFLSPFVMENISFADSVISTNIGLLDAYVAKQTGNDGEPCLELRLYGRGGGFHLWLDTKDDVDNFVHVLTEAKDWLR